MLSSGACALPRWPMRADLLSGHIKLVIDALPQNIALHASSGRLAAGTDVATPRSAGIMAQSGVPNQPRNCLRKLRFAFSVLAEHQALAERTPAQCDRSRRVLSLHRRSKPRDS